VVAFPNPGATEFSITVQSNANEKVMMQVIDVYGGVLETRNINPNAMIRFGDRYKAGTYFVRIIRGKEHKEIKLIKLSQ
jgi:type IX secretion system substrate protein